ncbi:unnamed protein product [Rotaria sordida]|uniref:Uncharacterized protein n=1 Tax=Rotaria sordida TaxID=392033 RepID=A0A818NXY3_9BILA|nr:unnamed protein product [Rotaria sordida]CAF3611895.1 unnamed protein product [Rotaria sordida]
MNLVQVRRCSNVNCRSQQQQNIDNTMIFTRAVYQVDATILCQLVKQIETKRLSKTFAQLLYLASTSQFELDRQICSIKNCGHQQRNVLLLTNVPDLISIAIDWTLSHCTTSDVEDFISIINPFINLHELFYDVTINDARIKQLNLIGLICFYGGNIEVFFSYDHTTLKWLFCFDGNIIVLNDWNAVTRKCIDFHLQPFLFIYANPDRNPVDISQLLKRTVIQTKTMNFIPDEKRLEQNILSNNIKNSMITKKQDNFKQESYTLENLHKISSFATLNSSMLFMPKSSITNNSYINQEKVVKVMQQQLLKKETLSDTTSISSSSTSSPIVQSRHRNYQITTQQQREDTSSSGDSSISSQRDSGLSSGINDGSSDGSSRDSLIENEQTLIDSLIKQTERIMNDSHLDMSYATIEHYFEESLKYECANNYSSALESCQQALLLIEQILNINDNHNNGISIYARTKKNSLLLRIRSLQKRQIEEQENLTQFYPSTNSLISTFKPLEKKLKKNENIYDNNISRITSILSSTSKISRPKKNVKFSDNVALIVPTCDDTDEPPSEHLIHSFLRKIHQQQTTTTTTTTPDSDSDTPSLSNDIPIGLSECTLCHKRCSKNNQIGAYCSNCHFYMQRFQPMTSS